MHTPWGASHGPGTPHGEGITLYSTSSYGGFFVAPELNAKVPDYLRAATYRQLGEQGWYEEDQDWSIVAIVFPDRFSADDVKDAHRFAAMRFDFPGATNALADAYQRWVAEQPCDHGPTPSCPRLDAQAAIRARTEAPGL